jgi:protein SCO1/2
MDRRLLLLLLLALLALPGVAAAQGDGPGDPLEDVAYQQRLGEYVPLDLPFVDEAGQAVALGDYFGERPVLLALGYYECPMLCSLVREGLVGAVSDVQLDVGADYQVVYVSIDPAETPMNAANTKAVTLAEYGRPASADGWHFLTGPQDSIQRLADAIGFGYFYDETIDQYAHAAGIVVLTPQGELARYFYGIEYNPSDLRLGLVEAADNKIGSPVDQLLLLCYSYDPTTGRYTGLVMTVLRVVSAIFVVAFLGLLFFLNRGTGTPGSPPGPAPAAG